MDWPTAGLRIRPWAARLAARVASVPAGMRGLTSAPAAPPPVTRPMITLRAAVPLSAESQKQLSDKLKKFTGKEIELDVKEDSELIGGITVKIGDWVLDSSLRGQLRRLKESFN